MSQIIDCQIDHIVPENISFNSNWENLVLTLNNSAKGNKLAREFINNDQQIIGLWNDLYKVDKKEKGVLAQLKTKKLKNLMMTRTELSNHNFINSNLSETTYAIRKAKNGLTFFFENFSNNYIDKKSSEYEKISDCDIRTINGFITNKLRNEFFRLPEKDRKISNHHSHDASMLAMFSSFDHINNFYNKIKNIGSRKYIIEKLYGKQNDNISIKDLNNIVKNSEELKNRILNSKCIYSFKKISIFPKGFDDKSIEEQWQIIQSLKPKQIFSNQNLDGYVEIDNNKHKVEYMQLNDFLLNKNYDTIYKNLLILFKDMQKILLGIDEKDLKSIKEKIDHLKENGNSFAKKIITNWKTLFQLYNCIKKDIDDIDLQNKKPQWIFQNYIDKLKQGNYLEGLRENGIVANNEYIENVLKKYIPLIDLENYSFTKVYRIKFINIDKYYFSKNAQDKKQSNKSIFNFNKYKKLSMNTSHYGDATKAFAVIKYKDKNKEKIDIFKINEMNKIVSEPEGEHEVIRFLDMKKWYLIDNEIYCISNYNKSNLLLYIKSISNNNIKEISKTYKSWSNYGDNTIQEIIFKKMICKK